MKEALVLKTILLAIEDKGTEQDVDFLLNIYGKYHIDDRKIRNKTTKAA